VRILELAEQLIRLSGLVPYHDVQIVFTGLRPGEKLEEELVAPNETLNRTSVDKIRVVAGNGGRGATLARQIRSLIAVTVEGNERGVVKALTAIVSEYQPESLELVGATSRRNGNGHLKRHANGHANGNANGHANGHANGNANGNGAHRRAISPEPREAPSLPPPRSGGAVAGGGSAQ
jgi:polysaccharide biosynthesis protein